MQVLSSHTRTGKVTTFGYHRKEKGNAGSCGTLWRLEGGKEEEQRAREGKDDVISTAGYQVGSQERGLKSSRGAGGIRAPGSCQEKKVERHFLENKGCDQGAIRRPSRSGLKLEEKAKSGERPLKQGTKKRMQQSENSLQVRQTKKGEILHAPVRNPKCKGYQ